jgi:CBS domain containing-hemolysin-like protein
MVVTEANELFDANLPTGAWDTVGGLLFDLLGHVPKQGESVDIGRLRLVADRVKGRRIERVRIIPLSSLAAG